VKNLWKAIVCVAVLAAAVPVCGQSAVPPVDELVKRIQEVYSPQCCFRASFDQVTVNVAMDMRDHFTGEMYVRKPDLIALDVQSPEKQQVVLRGRSYAVYFPGDGTAVRGEVPPEMNVEHFFGFLANIGGLDKTFSIAYPTKAVDDAEHLYFLQLTDPHSVTQTYRIVVGIDMRVSLIRRAIIYDALGNYNRFELSDITFSTDIPDSRFRIGPGARSVVEPAKPDGQNQRATE
jgi:outer membrane lipoprotein-sorting protein